MRISLNIDEIGRIFWVHITDYTACSLIPAATIGDSEYIMPVSYFD